MYTPLERAQYTLGLEVVKCGHACRDSVSTIENASNQETPVTLQQGPRGSTRNARRRLLFNTLEEARAQLILTLKRRHHAQHPCASTNISSSSRKVKHAHKMSLSRSQPTTIAFCVQSNSVQLPSMSPNALRSWW